MRVCLRRRDSGFYVQPCSRFASKAHANEWGEKNVDKTHPHYHGTNTHTHSYGYANNSHYNLYETLHKSTDNNHHQRVREQKKTFQTFSFSFPFSCAIYIFSLKKSKWCVAGYYGGLILGRSEWKQREIANSNEKFR